MQKQIKILLTLFTILFLSLFLSISCAKNNPSNPNDNNNNTNNNNNNNQGTGKRGEYKLLTDADILALPWTDQRKKDYFYSNWMNTFTNQTFIPGGMAFATRTTDEKATYLEDGQSHGDFIYATNIEWKGTNWIGALYNDPTRPGYDSKWMIFLIDTDGKLMIGSGFGSGATGNEPPTEEYWKNLMGEGGYGPSQYGSIENFDYKK